MYSWSNTRKRQIPFIELVFSRIIKKYNNVKLLLIGPFVENTTDIFETKLFPQFKNNLICVGEVKNPIPYVKKSDIFVCYSEFECFPISNLEAMFCGKPICINECFWYM